MKLRTVRVREFQSVWDSNPFEIDKITCLVGKNEAGKTALLQALYRLNPIDESDGKFDVVDDYPRSEVEDYQQDIEGKKRQPAVVVEATFQLEEPELKAIFAEYGDDVLERPEVEVKKGYSRDQSGSSQLLVSVPIVESTVVRNLVAKFELPEALAAVAAKEGTLEGLSRCLTEAQKKQDQAFAEAQAAANQLQDEAAKASAMEEAKALMESEKAKALSARLLELRSYASLGQHIWDSVLKPVFPKFLYFDEYYQLKGQDNIQALKARMDKHSLEPHDHPLLGLIDLARLDLNTLVAPQSTQELKNKLQGASNHLSSEILRYWSQNRHLRINFDVRGALPGDPRGMTSGMNIWGEVYDTKHEVSTLLGKRSAGFVWFFSFLAWYSKVKKEDSPLVLLLDEPGLSLHGRAQHDLVQYFELEVATNPKHQLIYTTHSPFMVDPQHFERVRIVQDKGIDADNPLPRQEDGTKVFTDVLDAGTDSLFPLQGALGYDIYQTLFIGPNSLIVEGVSDLLYLQTVSGILESLGRVGLDSRWTITPVGGSDKVPTFVALIGSQRNLNVATLVDVQKGDQQTIENLYRKKLLKKTHVRTFADFTGKTESDIEDMFDEAFYVDLVNREFANSLAAELKAGDLTSCSPRILIKVEDYLTRRPLKSGARFSHYRPARFFAENAPTLVVPEATLNRFELAFTEVNALLA